MKKYIIISLIGIAITGTCYANWFTDLFQESDLAGTSFSPFMLNGTTIKPKVSTWGLEIASSTFDNATTTGSFYIGGDLSVSGDTTLVDVYLTNYEVTGNSTTTNYQSIGTDDGYFNFTAGDINASGELRVGEGATFNGNVGIGTTSPQALLDVFGTSNKLRLSYTQTNYADLSTNSAGDFSILPSTDNKIFNLGTTSPSSRWNVKLGGTLTVNPGSTGGYVRRQAAQFTTGDNTATGLYLMGGNNIQEIGFDYAYLEGGKAKTANPASIYKGDDGSLTFRTATGQTIGAAPTWQTPLFLSNNGNVGIGTTTPLARISVQGGGNDVLKLASSLGTELVTVQNDGNVGIGTTSPAMKFSVHGDALADSWNVYSDIYKGDALTKLKGIKAETGTTGDWVKVDHNSLPEGILKNNLVEYNKEIPATKTTATTTEHISYILQTMSISNLAVMNSRAIVQLDERLTSVEMSKIVGGSDDQSEAIRKLEVRIEELEKRQGIIERFINWLKNL